MEKDGIAYVQELTDGGVSWVPVTIGVEGDVEAEIIPAGGPCAGRKLPVLIAEPGGSTQKEWLSIQPAKQGDNHVLKNGEELPSLRKT